MDNTDTMVSMPLSLLASMVYSVLVAELDNAASEEVLTFHSEGECLINAINEREITIIIGGTVDQPVKEVIVPINDLVLALSGQSVSPMVDKLAGFFRYVILREAE